MKKLTIILTFIVIAFSQEFDLYSLFPHHEGDIWEYNFLNADEPLLRQTEIVSDTLIEGVALIKTRTQHYYDNMIYFIDYLVDDNYNVWKYDTTWFCCDTVLWYKLNAEPGDEWEIRREGSYVEKMVFDGYSEGYFWGQPTTFAHYDYYMGWPDYQDTTDMMWEWGKTEVLASGWGLVEVYTSLNGGVILLGAVLDGEVYGYVGTEPNDVIPIDFVLKPACPNPFNPTTTISYDIPHESHVTLTVYDLMGRELETLVNTIQPIGNHQITWDASNYSSGIYLVELISEEYRSVQKLMLIK